MTYFCECTQPELVLEQLIENEYVENIIIFSVIFALL